MNRPGAWIVGLLLSVLTTVLPRDAAAQTLDHYTLVMAWLPGQCLVNPDRPLCEKLTIKDPAGRNLTLVGLRPDPRAGSVPLRDCDPMSDAFSTPLMEGDVDPVGMDACRLPAVKLSDPLAKALSTVMPTTAQCGERRFWASYGSCSMLSQERYFQRAVDRATDLQRSLLNATIAGGVGTRVRLDAVTESFTQQFGDENAASLQLICGRSKERRLSVLTEVRVALRQLGTMQSLTKEALWHETGSSPRHRCPDTFLIAEPGQPEPDPIAKPAAPGTIAIPQMPQIPEPVVPTVTPPVIAVPTITAPQKPDPTKPQPMDTEPMVVTPPLP